MTTPAADLRLHTTIAGRYRLDRVLGAGGMGVVYVATHTLLDRQVAVKLLHAEFARQPEAKARFVREATASAKLRHPNVVEVHDAGVTEDGAAYLVLELLEGAPLSSYLDERQVLDAATVISLFRPIVAAMAYAHERGFVHRDLKPDNIFLSRDVTGRMIPKVLDFGIAKNLESKGGAGATQTGAVIGTPLYMAPEQAHGRSTLGVAADVWSLGVILYQCLAGRLPFDFPTDATLTQVLFTVAFEKPLPLATVAPHVSPALAAVVDRCLANDPDHRYRDAKSLGEALAPFDSSSSSSREFVPSSSATFPSSSRPALSPWHSDTRSPDTTPPRETDVAPSQQADDSNRRRIAIAALAVVLVVGIAGGLMASQTSPAPNPGATRSAPSSTSTASSPTIAMPVVPPSPSTEPRTVRPSSPTANSAAISTASEDASVPRERESTGRRSVGRTTSTPRSSTPASPREPENASPPTQRRCDGEVVNGVCMSL